MEWAFTVADIFIVLTIKVYACLGGWSFDTLKTNLQKGKLAFQTRSVYAAKNMMKP